MIYIVLGMHKSGTTLVSQILHHSQIFMGNEFDETLGYKDNKYEWRKPFLVNLDLVGAVESEYFSLDHYKPCTTNLPEATRQDMLDIVAERDSAGGDWGFKEPLTCLTYTHWAKLLPPHKVIGVYRNPGQVMRHYHTRPWGLHRGYRVLRAWTNYNHAMLQAVRASGHDAILLRYEELMAGQSEYDRLQRFTERKLNDQRKAGNYHGRTTHVLFDSLDRLMAGRGPLRPSRILSQLDQLRAAQLQINQEDTP